MKMTQQMRDALGRVPGWAQGTKVTLDHTKYCVGTLIDLRAAGFVGLNSGLTRKGSIHAQRIQEAREKELFG